MDGDGRFSYRRSLFIPGLAPSRRRSSLAGSRFGNRPTALAAFGSPALLLRFKIIDPLVASATAAIGLIVFPLLQPASIFVK
jgi:hypothetical protein